MENEEKQKLASYLISLAEKLTDEASGADIAYVEGSLFSIAEMLKLKAK